MKKILSLLLACALAAAALPQGVITDGDARFEFNVGGSGSADFQPDGTTDHLFQNWWWYRINGISTSEIQFGSPADSESYVGNVASLDWSVVTGPGIPQFRANLRVQLNDGGSPGEATLLEEMSIFNTSGSAISLSIFNYADFDVSGTFGGDSATIAGDIMTITDGTTGDFAQFQGVGANAYQVTAFATLRTLLDDGFIDNLNNTGLPFGPGDFTGAFQWDVNLAAGGSTVLTERLSVNTPIPEPASMIALGLGVALLARRRRKRA